MELLAEILNPCVRRPERARAVIRGPAMTVCIRRVGKLDMRASINRRDRQPAPDLAARPPRIPVRLYPGGNAVVRVS